MRFGVGQVKMRGRRQASLCRGTLRVAVFLAASVVPRLGALPAAPTCRPAPFQQTAADFLDYFTSRMAIAGVRNLARSEAGANAVRYAAPATGFRLGLEYGEGQTLMAVEGLIRSPTDRDMQIFKEAAVSSFAYLSELAENSVAPMVEARIAALQQKKGPSTAYNGEIYLLLFPTGDGASMFRIRRIECR